MSCSTHCFLHRSTTPPSCLTTTLYTHRKKNFRLMSTTRPYKRKNPDRAWHVPHTERQMTLDSKEAAHTRWVHISYCLTFLWFLWASWLSAVFIQRSMAEGYSLLLGSWNSKMMKDCVSTRIWGRVCRQFPEGYWHAVRSRIDFILISVIRGAESVSFFGIRS